VAKTITLDPNSSAVLQRSYQTYRRIYPALRTIQNYSSITTVA
jgi:hypothetical protein